MEHGVVRDVLDREKIAVIAQWSPTTDQALSLATLTEELSDVDYGVVVVSAAETREPLRWPRPLRPSVTVVRRPNRGYDFGSWASALRTWPHIGSRRQVILANDSLVGPFASMGPILADFEASPADVWGMTSSEQFGHHLQSFFIGYHGGLLSEPLLRSFWAGIRHLGDKQSVISKYELGLSRLLWREGYCMSSFLSARTVVESTENPMITGWRGVLDRGVPFVKREILRDPAVVSDATDAPAEIRRRFGEEVEAWL